MHACQVACKVRIVTSEAPTPAEIIATSLSQLRGRRPHRPELHGSNPNHDHGEQARGTAGNRHGERRRGGLALMRLVQSLTAAQRPLSVSDLGEAVGVDQPRASRLVQQAVAYGLVEREADPEDARRTRIVLTDHGREFVKRATSEQQETLADALTALDEQEQAELARLLSKLAANWRV